MTSPDTPAEETAELLDRRTVRFTDALWKEIGIAAAKSGDSDRSCWIRNACRVRLDKESTEVAPPVVHYLGRAQTYMPKTDV